MAKTMTISPTERQIAARPHIKLWLYGVATLLIAMVLIGGATRLTNSGLSITEWQPMLGVIPPLGADAWQEAFAKYREIPEYQHRQCRHDARAVQIHLSGGSGLTAFSAASSAPRSFCPFCSLP